jgi:hypothetical protein
MQFRGRVSLALCHVVLHPAPAIWNIREKPQKVYDDSICRQELSQDLSRDAALITNLYTKPMTLDKIPLKAQYARLLSLGLGLELEIWLHK